MLITFLIILLIWLCIFFYNKSLSLRWKSINNIRVYIPANNYWNSMMKQAFLEWSKVSKNNILFEFVESNISCDIEVIFQDKYKNAKWYDEKIGNCETEYIGNFLNKAKIYIVQRDCILEKRFSEPELYSIMLHEIGHSLGLKHLSSPKSVMYFRINSDTPVTSITNEDIKSLEQLYKFN